MQIDNSDITPKLILREHGLKQLDNISVINLFAGTGVIYDKLYTEHPCINIDKKQINRPGWIKSDNRKALKIFLQSQPEINYFDCDAYSNPWIIANDICRLRKEGKFVIIPTCGIGRGLKNGNSNQYIRQITNTTELSDRRLLWRWYDDIIQWIINSWKRYNTTVLECKRFQNKRNSDVYYYYFLLNKSELT